MTTSTKKKIIPLTDRVLIQRLAEEEKTASGIYLPDSAKEKKTDRGSVVAVGKGKKDDKGNLIQPTVKEGDVVLMEKYGGQEISLDGEDFVIISEKDILAIIQ